VIVARTVGGACSEVSYGGKIVVCVSSVIETILHCDTAGWLGVCQFMLHAGSAARSVTKSHPAAAALRLHAYYNSAGQMFVFATSTR